MNDEIFRVLLIEDNASDQKLIRRALDKCRTEFDLEVASDLAEGKRALRRDTWDVVLSDLSLPDGSGLDAVRELRAFAPEIPMIVLTGLASDEIALQSLDHGAQDFLVKDGLSPETLERSIRYAMQRQKSVEMRQLLEKLQSSERALAKKNRRLARLYKTAHRFVDNVSHEFRTPLTVVNEYVSLLRDGVVGGLNVDQKRMLDVIGDRAEDLNNMVDDMLDISKLEAGMLGMWRRHCRIADIVAHVSPSLSRKSSVKEVELQFDIPDNLPDVFCDDEKIGRVIINLTVNAIKFSGQPGRVQVWANYDEAAREVIVGVTDNGQGISPENFAVIFERFKQVVGNPRGSTKGFGLGLNIAKELVQLNFGEIHLKSQVGKGSTFWFGVPIADPLEVTTRYLKRISQCHSGPCAVSLLLATFSPPLEGPLADDINAFLNSLLRRNDLVFRLGEDIWLVAVPCEQSELERLFQRSVELRETVNRNRLGEPLPPVELHSLGTWLVPRHLEDVVEMVERTVRPQVAGQR